MSSERKEYESLKGLLDGSQVNTLDKKIILDCVAQQTLLDLGSANLVYVLHDPCDIRKPYSSDLEHLGKELSLQKKYVTEVIVEQILMLDKKNTANESE